MTRIVGQDKHTLSSILEYRASVYENAYDHRVLVSNDAAESTIENITAQVQQVLNVDQTFSSTRGQKVAKSNTALDGRLDSMCDN